MLTSNKKNNSPIAFFDSGVGGLTVLNRVKNILPEEDMIYYGDTLHMPYGEKTKEQLLQYSDKIFKFFEKKNCKAVVMACNTTSSMIYEDVKNKYNLKIYPIVQSVAKILSCLEIERLGIVATNGTIMSGAYAREINRYNKNIKVFSHACPSWVHIVEEDTKQNPQSIETIKQDLDIILENKPQKIVLGCTHYPYLLDVLTQFAPKDLFIDPALDFARFIKDDLKKSGLLKDTYNKIEDEFYVSANPEQFRQSAKLFYELKDIPTVM